jgi:hypothetical protein
VENQYTHSINTLSTFKLYHGIKRVTL